MVCFMAVAVVKKALPKSFAVFLALYNFTVQVPDCNDGKRH